MDVKVITSVSLEVDHRFLLGIFRGRSVVEHKDVITRIKSWKLQLKVVAKEFVT